MQEERFSLGEKSDRMVTLTPFMGKLKSSHQAILRERERRKETW